VGSFNISLYSTAGGRQLRKKQLPSPLLTRGFPSHLESWEGVRSVRGDGEREQFEKLTAASNLIQGTCSLLT
jgi:hypothetical protein